MLSPHVNHYKKSSTSSLEECLNFAQIYLQAVHQLSLQVTASGFCPLYLRFLKAVSLYCPSPLPAPSPQNVDLNPSITALSTAHPELQQFKNVTEV